MLARSVSSSLLLSRTRFVVARCQPLFLSVRKDNEPPSTLTFESCQEHSKKQVKSKVVDGVVCGLWINESDSAKREPAVLDSDADAKRPSPVAIHEDLAKQLMPHQFDGVQFMYNNTFGSLAQFREGVSGGGCILADAPGLGKTIQCVAFVHTVLSHPELSTKVKKVLILAPANTIINCRDEFDKWLNNDGASLKTFDVTVLNLVKKKDRLSTLTNWHSGDQPSVMISSFEMYSQVLKCDEKAELTERAKFEKCLQNPGPDMLIVDEAHKLKNPKSQFVNRLSRLETKLRICITGTPLQNNPVEYYEMANFMRPGVVGDKPHFKQTYSTPITKGGTKDAYDNEVQRMKRRSHLLNKTLKPYVLRRDSSALINLIPPMIDHAILVRPTPAQIRVYQDVLQLMEVVYERKRQLENPLTNYHQRVWNHAFASFSEVLPDSLMTKPRLSIKLDLLMEIINACEKNHDKLLVFSQSLTSLDLIKKRLEHHDRVNRYSGKGCIGDNENWGWQEGHDWAIIDGDTSYQQRDSIRRRLNDPNDLRMRLLLISTTAGSLGTNMVGANRVVIFDASWNPTHDNQALCRVYRIGQKKPTFVYRLIAQGTMEECIYNRQVFKTSTLHRVLDEHQIERQFTKDELDDLDRFDITPYVQGDERKMDPPKDPLLANLIQSHPEAIVSCKVHSDYFVNQVHERLTDEEREAAWRQHQFFESKRASSACESFNFSLMKRRLFYSFLAASLGK